ncbi:MAG: acetyl-CoA carboxylase biotin carboxyl carrier protein subunit [Bacteriovoracaceae bacterium]|nr:acetyl-CoA carboxylase biotin carboxyl carrier protein subunit [Bacteriovoracaceae bacterium]
MEKLKNIFCYNVGDKLQVFIDGEEFWIESQKKKKRKREDEAGTLTSPMPGKILKYLVKKDQEVEKGEPLLILEAMKMEHTIKAPLKGVVTKLFFKEGEQVPAEAELISLHLA